MIFLVQCIFTTFRDLFSDKKVERLAGDTDTYRLQYVISAWWMILLVSYIGVSFSMYLGVSKNRGIPKWMIDNGKTLWNWMIWGYLYVRKHPYYLAFLPTSLGIKTTAPDIGIFLAAFQVVKLLFFSSCFVPTYNLLLVAQEGWTVLLCAQVICLWMPLVILFTRLEITWDGGFKKDAQHWAIHFQKTYLCIQHHSSQAATATTTTTTKTTRLFTSISKVSKMM